MQKRLRWAPCPRLLWCMKTNKFYCFLCAENGNFLSCFLFSLWCYIFRRLFTAVKNRKFNNFALSAFIPRGSYECKSARRRLSKKEKGMFMIWFAFFLSPLIFLCFVGAGFFHFLWECARLCLAWWCRFVINDGEMDWMEIWHNQQSDNASLACIVQTNWLNAQNSWN